MKYEITVLRTDGRGLTILADRCTLTAESVQDAARQYAELFAVDDSTIDTTG